MLGFNSRNARHSVSYLCKTLVYKVKIPDKLYLFIWVFLPSKHTTDVCSVVCGITPSD